MDSAVKVVTDVHGIVQFRNIPYHRRVFLRLVHRSSHIHPSFLRGTVVAAAHLEFVAIIWWWRWFTFSTWRNTIFCFRYSVQIVILQVTSFGDELIVGFVSRHCDHHRLVFLLHELLIFVTTFGLGINLLNNISKIAISHKWAINGCSSSFTGGLF